MKRICLDLKVFFHFRKKDLRILSSLDSEKILYAFKFHVEGMASTPPAVPGYVNFITAGLGGIIGWTVVHPLNTLSIRMNLIIAQNAGLQPNQQERLSFVRFSTDIIKNESVGALYRGLTAGWLRQVFFATSIYGFYEIFRDQLAKFSDDLGYAARAVAGVGSGGEKTPESP